MSNTNIINKYYEWLTELVRANQKEHSYFLLLSALHAREFIYLVPNDDNRAADGIALREQWADEEGVNIQDVLDSPCSVLEMLIGLAYRCESMTNSESDDDMTMSDWFWKMLSNCELSKFTDENYYDYHGPIGVTKILDRILDRQYHRNGTGGFFPLNHPKTDQRKVELWYQMSTYIINNYFPFG